MKKFFFSLVIAVSCFLLVPQARPVRADLDIGRKISAAMGGQALVINTLKVRVYPNPVKGKAALELRIITPTWIKIEIFNSGGKCVIEIDKAHVNPGLHHWSISPAAGEPGIYFCRITSRSGYYAGKIIIT